MKNDLLKASLWIVGIIVVAYLIGKAIVNAMKISVEGQLATVKAKNEHKEKMVDKLMQYHHQAFSHSRHCFYSTDDLRPTA
jgi:hypothetical protein